MTTFYFQNFFLDKNNLPKFKLLLNQHIFTLFTPLPLKNGQKWIIFGLIFLLIKIGHIIYPKTKQNRKDTVNQLACVVENHHPKTDSGTNTSAFGQICFQLTTIISKTRTTCSRGKVTIFVVLKLN